VQALGIGRALAVPGVKTEKAQDAQIIFGDPLRRITDEADPARGEVGETVNIIVQLAVRRQRQRIDREIAPHGVGDPVPAEHNLGLAAIGFDITPQRCHFERFVRNQDGDGAMLDAGGNGLPARRFDAPHDLIRQGRGRNIDFMNGQAQQRIADGAADNARFFGVAVEKFEQRRRFAAHEPGDITE
jgi:hypothetical protein